MTVVELYLTLTFRRKVFDRARLMCKAHVIGAKTFSLGLYLTIYLPSVLTIWKTKNHPPSTRLPGMGRV